MSESTQTPTTDPSTIAVTVPSTGDGGSTVTTPQPDGGMGPHSAQPDGGMGPHS